MRKKCLSLMLVFSFLMNLMPAQAAFDLSEISHSLKTSILDFFRTETEPDSESGDISVGTATPTMSVPVEVETTETVENFPLEKLTFVSPEKGARNISGKTPVTFLFSESVFTLENPETVQNRLKKQIKMEPAIEGSWQILGTSGLLFEPKGEWINSTHYDISISAEVVGTKLEHHFETPRIELQSVDSSDLIFKRPITLTFSQKLDLTEARKIRFEPHIEFDVEYGTDSEKKTLENQIKITPREDWRGNTKFKMVVPKGFSSKEGPLPITSDIYRNFWTIKDFSIQDNEKPDDVFGSYRVRFSTSVLPEELVKHLEILPKPDEEVWAAYLKKITKNEHERSYFYLPPLKEYWSPQETYEIKISGDLTDQYGRKLERDFSGKFNVKFPTTFRQVFLPKHNSVLKPETKFKPTFWYSGDIRNITVEVKEVLLEKKKSTKSFSVEPSPDKEMFWEFDFQENFPEFFDEEGHLFPGKYEMEIKSEKAKGLIPEELKEKIGWHDHWWPKEHSTRFYVSEFEVGLKHLPGDEFEINVLAFPGEENLPEDFSYEVYKSKQYKEEFFPRPAQVFSAAKNLDHFKPEEHWSFELVVKAGDKIGIGSRSFTQGLQSNGVSVNQNFYERDQMRFTNFSDRPLYKPGQRVYFKSVFRNLITKGKTFPLKDANFAASKKFTIEIRDSRWNQIEKIDVTGTGGSFDGYWDIPEDAKHGNYQMTIRSDFGKNLGQIEFFVGEYRKSNFLLDGKFDRTEAFFKENAAAEVKANFAFGGALKNRPVTYDILLEGRPNCFWRYWEWDGMCESKDKTLDSGDAILDEDGVFQKPVNLDFEIDPKDPVWSQLKFRATVRDGDAEENSTEISIPFYMSTEKIILDHAPYHFEKNSEASVSGKITNWQDKVLEGKELSVQLSKTVPNPLYSSKKGSTDEERFKEEIVWTKSVTSDEQGKFEINFTVPEKAGSYKLLFSSVDAKGRKTEASNTFWVPGVDDRNIQLEDEDKFLPLILDKENYEVGDEVEVFIPHSEWEIVRARATLERGEVLEELSIHLENQTIQFKTEDWMVPNVYVSVLLEGKDKNNNPKIKWGIINVPITGSSRLLDIELVPNKDDYKPGDQAKFQIKTTVSGEAVPAELTVMVVDETLLSLKSRAKTDLLKIFLADLPAGISVSNTVANLITQDQINAVVKKISEMELREENEVFLMDDGADMDFAMNAMEAPQSRGLLKGMMRSMKQSDMVMEEAMVETTESGMGKDEMSSSPRENFQDTAKFVGKILTDENGVSELLFDLPDNLTTWNIFVVGHTEKNNFGSVEHSVKTKLPLLISEIVPNFFQMGDQLDIGLLIRRNVPLVEQENVRVQLQLPSGFETETKSQEITISEEGRVFFPIKISATDFDLKKDFETVKFGFSVVGETTGLQDTIILERKLFPPKVEMTAAEFLRVEDAKNINIKPDLARALTSKVLVKVFLSLAEKLENLIDVTEKRNYGCAEQRFSRSTAKLVQKQFDNRLGRKSPDVSRIKLNEDRTYIEKSFVAGGGFAFWKNAERADFWVTTQILEFADLWKTFGAEIDAQQIKTSQKWLNNQLLKKCDWKRFERNCVSDSTRQNAAYVLAQSNKISAKELNELSQYTHSLESKVWWLKTARLLKASNVALRESDERRIKDFWTEVQLHLKARDRYVFWEENKNYWSFYSQNERLTALIFEEILKENKLSNYQHKVSRYLSETKMKELSGNSALRVLQSLGQYAASHEAQNLGSAYAINMPEQEEPLKEGYLEKLDSEFEMEIEVTNDETFTGLEFETKNEKPFYADIQLKETFPADQISPVSRGFWVSREIYDLDDEKMENPLTKLALGKNYVVRLKLVTNTSHRQIVLEDKIPSGAEFVNFEFENTNKNLEKYAYEGYEEEEIGIYRGGCFGWCRPTFEHQEFHAEKARYFADYLSPGTYEVKYIIKTRLPGEFEVLPAKVEEMYYPEIFATTDGDRIIISNE